MFLKSCFRLIGLFQKCRDCKANRKKTAGGGEPAGKAQKNRLVNQAGFFV